MKKLLLIIISVMFLMTAVFSNSAVAMRSNGNSIPSRLGVNLEGLSDRNRALIFTDVMKTSRAWGLASNPGTAGVNTDANGWPTEDAGVIAMSGMIPMDNSGTYKLSFESKSSDVLISNVSCTFSVKNQVSSGGITTADIVVPFMQSDIMISFKNTNGGVRNVKLIRPGYSEKDEFTNLFLDAIKPFTTIRFMDFLNTNGQNTTSENPGYLTSPITWSERKLTTHASQSVDFGRARGGAWEYIIDLCNLTGKDAWINVPYGVDDDYLTKLATLFKEKLRSDCHIYVEVSNEVWNGMFAQAKLNTANSKKDPTANTNGKQYAKVTAQAALAFKSVFGAQAMNDRIRVVAAWHFGAWQPNVQASEILNWINDNAGKPSDLIYALAWAPYISEPPADQCTDIPTILNSFTDSSDNSVATKNILINVAKSYNLVGGSVCYEGGTHHAGEQVTTNVSIRNAANRDPGITPILVHDLKDNWFSLGGGLFCYFTLTSVYSQYGCWGLLENITDLSHPKYKAILQMANDDSTVPPVSDFAPDESETPTPTATPSSTPSPTPTVVKEGYIPVSGAAISSAKGTFKVSAAKAKIYATTSAKKTVATYKKGKKLKILSVKGQWAKLKVNRKTVYTKISNLTFTAVQKGKTIKSVKLYKAASASAPLKTLKNNTKINIVTRKGSYYKVKL